MGADRQRAALTKLLAEEWEYELKESPEAATIYGDYRYNDKVSDLSIAHTRANVEVQKRWLARFQAVDTTGFPEQEALNKTLMVRNLKEGIEGYDLKLWEMQVNQMSGIHLQIAQFVTIVPFNTTKQYEDWIARLKLIPTMLDQTIAVCELGRRDGLMPPKYLLEKVPGQARAIGTPAGEKSLFVQPVLQFPRSCAGGGSETAARRVDCGRRQSGPARVCQVRGLRGKDLRTGRPQGRGHVGAAQWRRAVPLLHPPADDDEHGSGSDS